MKLFWYIFFVLSASICLSQKVLNVDIDIIKERTNDITSPNYYPTLLNRFIDADTTLSAKQLHFLYYGQYNQSFYLPYDPSEGQEMMYNNLAEEEFDAALIYGKQAYDLNPLDLKTLFGIALCYHYLGDESQMDKYLWMYYSLISVIVESGTGKNVSSAMVVMSVSDEYEVINSLERTIKKQKLINNNTDLVFLNKTKNKNQNSLRKLYFNIQLPLKKVMSE